MSEKHKEIKESNLIDYSLDENLNKEYEEFNKKIGWNKNYLIIANCILCYGICSYFKKYHKRIFDRQRGIGKNFVSAILHSFGSIILICGVDAYLLGLTPSNIKKKKEFEDRLMYQSNYQINYDLLKDIIDDDKIVENDKKNNINAKV